MCIRQKMKEHETEDVRLYSDSGLIKKFFVKSKQIDCLFTLPPMYIKAIWILVVKLDCLISIIHELYYFPWSFLLLTFDQSISNVIFYIRLNADATNFWERKKTWSYVKQWPPFWVTRAKRSVTRHMQKWFPFPQRCNLETRVSLC